MSKIQDMTMHLLVVNSMLLLENLDVLKPTSKKMSTLKDTLTNFCEELANELNNSETIQKTTYFQEIATKVDNELSNKVNTIMRKYFNPNM